MMTNSTTKVYDEALQERVRKYMKDTGLSQNKLAPRIIIPYQELLGNYNL